MFRIELPTADLLESKPETIICNIPPCANKIELNNMQYLSGEDTYVIKHYNYKCQIIAKGDYFFHDIFKGTVSMDYLVVKTSIRDKDFYFLMQDSEQNEYIMKGGMLKNARL